MTSLITPSPPLQTIGTINHNFFAAGILLVYTANGLIAGCQCDRCPMNNIVLLHICIGSVNEILCKELNALQILRKWEKEN